jgi:NTP pyrophosphatase (non-canonical NTP hydrolase)
MSISNAEWMSIVVGLEALIYDFHDNAVEKGFYSDVDPDKPRDVLSIVAKIHEELGEVTQAISRKEPQESKAIPGFSELEEELADTFIRLLDFAAVVTDPHSFGRAVRAKHEYNTARPYRHGKAV